MPTTIFIPFSPNHQITHPAIHCADYDQFKLSTVCVSISMKIAETSIA
jgi:hypothetical protein